MKKSNISYVRAGVCWGNSIDGSYDIKGSDIDLSNNKIIEKYGISYRHPCKHINDKDFISISKYLHAEEECDVEYKNTHSIQNFEDSFQSFIIQEPSIILNS